MCHWVPQFNLFLSILHRVDKLAESLNLVPIGIIHHRIGCGWTFGHPHDQANHLTVKIATPRIIKVAAKDCQLLRLPCNLARNFFKYGLVSG